MLDGHGRFATVNAAAAQLLDVPAADLLGMRRPRSSPTGDGAHRPGRAPGGRRRDLAYRLAPIPDGHVVWFGDVTDAVASRNG